MNPSQAEVQSFRSLRKAVGYLGMCLPFILICLSCMPLCNTKIQESISAFYYTNLREIFTGILCAVGLFLIRYEGYKEKEWWKNDDKLTNWAGVMALCVAFFPTDPKDAMKMYTLISASSPIMEGAHLWFAGIFFGLLAYISFYVFTLGEKHHKGRRRSKFNENNCYRLCGIMIVLSMVLIAVTDFHYSTLLWETVALVSFGTSWLIKGRAVERFAWLKRTLY